MSKTTRTAPAASPPAAPFSETVTKSQLEKLRQVIEIASAPGNATRGYGHGMANGLILALAIIEDRDPDYIDPTDDLPPLAEQLQQAVDKITARA